MKLYIAGPMTGHPEHNWSAFREAKKQLEEAGYEVVSPVDVNGSYEEACVKPYIMCLREDVRAMLTCDGVALLDGWRDSNGASKEARIANMMDMPAKAVTFWLHNRTSTLHLRIRV
jgi:nucleoside 2-deoxyribosyltransferase